MRKITRGAAALVLGSALAASAYAQQPPGKVDPPPAGGGPVVPVVTPPAAKPEVIPTGNAATVNGQPITEKAVYRALRQFHAVDDAQGPRLDDREPALPAPFIEPEAMRAEQGVLPVGANPPTDVASLRPFPGRRPEHPFAPMDARSDSAQPDHAG